MNQISNELVSKLSTIQNAIESEKKVFIEKCRKVQEKLNFDLFDVSLRNKIIDVAHDINEANTDYYLFLKVKVDEVDSIAEKYLEKDLDYEAVERIYQVLHYINEESRIKNSFDASITEGFSTTDLGTMGVVSYSPSVHAREIELKWKSRLENMPANKKQEHYDKTQSEEQIKRTYTSKLVKWNRACKPILAQRESFIKNAIEQRASQIKVELDAEYSKKTC